MVAESDKSENPVYGIMLFMRSRPRNNRTEAERHAFKLESSKMSHAKARRITWGERHKLPARTSSTPPPSFDALRDAYRRRNESCEAMIRLGSMLEDIEAAHGVGYKFEKFDDSGTADSFFIDYDTPWQTGIRGFLKGAPDLLAVYKTLMRYKKLSADFRRAIGLQDPNPASLVFDGPDEAWLLPARKHAHEILNGCGRSFRALAKRIADFGQQSGLRPEPRKPPRPCTSPPKPLQPCANPRKRKQPAMRTKPRLDVAKGVRGKLPPVDVGRRRDA